MKTSVAFALASCTLLVAAANPSPSSPAAEGHILRPFAQKGDQWTTNTEFDLEIVSGTEEGKESSGETSWKLSRRDRFDTEALETTADLATKVRRDYVKSTAKLRLKAGKGEAVEKQEDSALHQASLVLEKDGDSTKIVSGGGGLSAELKAALNLDLLTSAFLPKEKTEEGKEWSVEASRIAAFLTQQIAATKGHQIAEIGGKLKVSLKGIKEEKSKKFAELPIEGEVTFTWITPKDGGSDRHKITWQPKGVLHFDPATSRPTRFSLDGKVTDASNGKGNARISVDVEDKIVPSGEGFRLLARFRPGDIATSTSKMKLEVGLDELTVLMNGKKMDTPTPEVAITISSTMKTVDEILEALEGRPKKLRREFVTVEFGMKGPMPAQPNPLEDLEGNTILVEEDEGEIRAKADAGSKVDENLIKGQTLGDEFRLFLPEEEVRKGSTWTPDEKKLTEMFAKMLPKGDDEEDEKAAEIIKSVLKKLSGGIDCKLLSISEEEGKSVARIALKGQINLDLTQDDLPKEAQADGAEIEISVQGKFEGEMLFDIKAGKPMQWGFSGPLTARVSVQQSNEEAGMDFSQLIRASGNLEIENTTVQGHPAK